MDPPSHGVFSHISNLCCGRFFLTQIREEATVIDWKPGQSLLLRPLAPPADAAGKAKGGAAAAADKQPKQQAGGKGAAVGKAGGGKAARRRGGKHGARAPDLPDPDADEEEDVEEVEQTAVSLGLMTVPPAG